jgi:methionyl-tRNA formyltransferase
LHDRLAPLGARALLQALPRIAAGDVAMQVQEASLVRYAAKLSKDEAELDWRRPALELERQVRAFNPWPVAQSRYAGAVLRIWAAEAVAGEAPPGVVRVAAKDAMEVGTGEGLLRITQLQLPGKRAMPVADFLHAHHPQGVTLG